MTLLLTEIASAWSWKKVQPVELIMQNEFGNVVFTDAQDRYWRICPEEPSCDVIANDRNEFEQLRLDTDFIEDWNMELLAREAEAALGPLADDRCYCLKQQAF